MGGRYNVGGIAVAKYHGTTANGVQYGMYSCTVFQLLEKEYNHFEPE
jgi:hypothetical protein